MSLSPRVMRSWPLWLLAALLMVLGVTLWLH